MPGRDRISNNHDPALTTSTAAQALAAGSSIAYRERAGWAQHTRICELEKEAGGVSGHLLRSNRPSAVNCGILTKQGRPPDAAGPCSFRPPDPVRRI
jgi:hypothetical protein